MATTIRITARNNSDARRYSRIDGVHTLSCRHNGGKLVIATVNDTDVDAARAALDADHAVASYDVEVSS